MINENQVIYDMGYSLLIIIVNRGKGSKIMQFARLKGANEVSCFLGEGTVQNNVLQLLEMNNVNKEIVLIVVPSVRENEILDELSSKFHFEKQNHGIAFTMPLTGLLKLKGESAFKYKSNNVTIQNQSRYSAVFLVVDKGKAETVIEISQSAGYYGGTIIKARGAASSLNMILDMLIEPEKEAVLMVTENNRVKELAKLLNEQLDLAKENTGILVRLGISKTIGMYQSDKE